MKAARRRRGGNAHCIEARTVHVHAVSHAVGRCDGDCHAATTGAVLGEDPVFTGASYGSSNDINFASRVVDIYSVLPASDGPGAHGQASAFRVGVDSALAGAGRGAGADRNATASRVADPDAVGAASHCRSGDADDPRVLVGCEDSPGVAGDVRGGDRHAPRAWRECRRCADSDTRCGRDGPCGADGERAVD